MALKRKDVGIAGDMTAARPVMPPMPGAVPSTTRTVLVQFRCTEPMAKLMHALADEHGGLRRMFARLLRDAGHTIPERDISPPDPAAARRRQRAA